MFKFPRLLSTLFHQVYFLIELYMNLTSKHALILGHIITSNLLHHKHVLEKLTESSPVSPLTCSNSAVRRNAVRLSRSTFTSPRYINSIMSFKLPYITSFSMTTGCLHGFILNSCLKKGLQIESTSLCACRNLPSTDRVTSTMSLAWKSSWKPEVRFEWKLFHRRENCSVVAIFWNLNK